VHQHIAQRDRRPAAGIVPGDIEYGRLRRAGYLDQVRAQFDSQLKKRQREVADKAMVKARTSDSMQEVAKLTRIADGGPQVIAGPSLLVPGRHADQGRRVVGASG
jgi:hypothetical protein